MLVSLSLEGVLVSIPHFNYRSNRNGIFELEDYMK